MGSVNGLGRWGSVKRIEEWDNVLTVGLCIEGYGDNEDLIGEWFETRGKRDEVSHIHMSWNISPQYAITKGVQC